MFFAASADCAYPKARGPQGRLATSTRNGSQLMDFDWTQGDLAEGLRRYEAGEFFAAHEAWETVWLRSQEPEKTFLQGLIQVTAAFHHLRRDNPRGAALLLKAALQRLERYPEMFGGVSITFLCNDIRERLRALDRGELPSLGSVRIRPGEDTRGRSS